MISVQTSNQSLIPCTDKQEVLTKSKQSFQVFLKIYADCGGEVNETTVSLIKDSIDENGFTANEVEEAVKACFEKEQFFNWANIVNHITKEERLCDERALIRKKRREYASSN